MIGLDTNVLLRLLLDDDPSQRQRIDALLAEHGVGAGTVLITDVVLAEAAWTLAGAYGQSRAAIAGAVRALLAEPSYAFESRTAVAAALEAFVARRAGFADCLIVAKNTETGSLFTATSDRGLKSVPGARVL